MIMNVLLVIVLLALLLGSFIAGVAVFPTARENAILVATVTEAARHRYPDVPPAEALDRYVVDLRSTNHYHRGKEREKAKLESETAEYNALTRGG